MNWTPESDEILRTHWREEGSHALAIRLGHSRHAVVARARYLGIIPHIKFQSNGGKGRRGWTKDEDDTIRAYWGTSTVIEISEMLSRSRKCISARAIKLGLPTARDEQEMESNDPALSPCKPTTAEPGSPEKIAELRHRLHSKQHLWHIDDPVLRHPQPAMRTFSGLTGRVDAIDESGLDSLDLEDGDE